MTKQPEALRLVDILANHLGGNTANEAATELRRLHEVNVELLAALEQALPEIDCGTHTGDRAWDAVSAAIDKAAGETPIKSKVWECNECGAQEYSGNLSDADVHKLGCGNCGSSEFHLADGKATGETE